MILLNSLQAMLNLNPASLCHYRVGTIYMFKLNDETGGQNHTKYKNLGGHGPLPPLVLPPNIYG